MSHDTPVSAPRLPAPPDSCDTHMHIYEPGYKLGAEAAHPGQPATLAHYREVQKRLGLARTVIVQATCHGADNRALVDALLASNGTARGVATVRRDVPDAELDALHAAGVRGVRFNFVRRLVDVLPFAALRAIAERIAPRGWHIVIYFEARELPALYDFFAALPTPVVIDHMGRPDVTQPIDGPEFALFLRLLREQPRFWSKVGGAERLSSSGPPDYTDFVPFARRVVEQFPDRVLWGTDWPHPNMKSHMPDDGTLVDLIPRIAPTAALQQKLLVDNPMRLYWSD